MPGIALYKIADDYKTALAFLDDVETEPDAEALTQLLSEVTDRFEDKAANVVAYMRNVEAEAEAFKAEAARLAARQKALEKRAENLREYLSVEMRRCNLTECTAGFSSLKFVKNPWTVELDAGIELPDDYMRFKPVPAPEPDKTKIAEALKAGVEIPGARLIQKERLKIA
jgi:hypothetical protein